ncbi:putative mucin-4-like [Apostichopus japonicus]|uniref:Putative mucin-4-like n=1 Tax=Stichopus japonicus TaxID=307972 RepID=A0A2G8KR10_STIJA|nr:putative mucin-4-like [Apostichopus japonicus]
MPDITENGVIVFVDKETDRVNAEDFSYPADLSNVEDSLVAVMWGHLISANVRHRVYDNPDSPEDASVLERLGSYVREWDRTQFASSDQFIPSWALAINWESVTHLDYPHLKVVWPVSETLVIGFSSDTEAEVIDLSTFNDVIFEQSGGAVYNLHESEGNTGTLGTWLFRLDQNIPMNNGSKQRCLQRYEENLADVLMTENVIKCPRHVTSMFSLQFYTCTYELPLDADTDTYGYPKPSMCLSQKLLNHYPMGTPGAYCSYDADGFLVDSISQNNVWDSTVIQRVHPTNRQFETQDHVTEWFRSDVDFRYQCCIASRSVDFCRLYQSLRPSPEIVGSDAEQSSAGFYGAGHFVTFDGLEYNFNAIGEFTVLRIEEAGLEIQARLIPRGNKSETLQASVISAITIQMDADELQITVRGESNNFTVDINGAKMPINHLADVVYRISERFSVSWGPNPSDKSSNVFDVVLLPVVPVNQTMDTFIRIGVVSGSMTYLMTMSEKAAERSSTEGLLVVLKGIEDSPQTACRALKKLTFRCLQVKFSSCRYKMQTVIPCYLLSRPEISTLLCTLRCGY